MHHKWTHIDEEYLRKHYKKDMTVPEICAHLKLSSTAVRNHADVLGLGAHRGPQHQWTEDEQGYIRMHYRGTNASYDELAGHFKVSRYAVKGQVNCMGLATKTDRKPWSPPEDEVLATLIGQYCPKRVAKMMHRSINSVVLRAKRIHVSRRLRDGWFTKREVCEILGVDHHWVQRRIDRKDIEASWHNETRPQKCGGGAWHIEQTELVRFIREHAIELNGRNVDLTMIILMLNGERH